MGARWCTVLLLAALVAAARASDAEVKRSGVFIARNLLHKIDHKIVLEVSTDAIEKSGDSVTVTWSGVEKPDDGDMIAMYLADRDVTETYPMKYMWTSFLNDGFYASKGKATFQLYNYYEPVVFYFLRGGFKDKYVAASSERVGYAAPQQPTQVKLAFTEDPSEMRVSWIAAERGAPVIAYGLSKDNLTLTVEDIANWTYTAAEMCGHPANSSGWKHPGTIISGVLTDLEPNTRYYYTVSDAETGDVAGPFSFLSAPGPQDTVKMLAVADMGQYNKDKMRNFGYWYSTYQMGEDEFYALGTLPYTAEHLTMMVVDQSAEQDGTFYTYPALYDEVDTEEYHSLWHNGDVAYARGAAWQWDTFGHLMEPIASRVPVMYSLGNHEYDFPGAFDGRFPNASDSGGECGVPAKRRAPQPYVSDQELWYSIDHGPVHFLQINTEMDFAVNSTQWRFVVDDLESVDRTVTPWVVVGFHRMMYTDNYLSGSPTSGQTVATDLREAFEALFFDHGVDMTWQGHLHIYQRTCPVFNNTCLGYDADGVALGPIHITHGHAGFQLTPFYQPTAPAAFAEGPDWAGFGYLRAEANATHFTVEAVDAETRDVVDSLTLVKPADYEGPSVADNALTREEIEPTPFPDQPKPAGWTLFATKIFNNLVREHPEEALAQFGPGSEVWNMMNGNEESVQNARPVVQSVLTVTKFIDTFVNETNYEDFIPADHDADTVWESYNYIKSAYEGRISDIVLAN
ncbi:hypothetical protein QBZ16_005320 [Prototheca wickerhamii]|uniref:Purple acid phosphatase n=1 Tax=Prototheca wickerhamii TaxID=3111 RepID=A0AAD9MJH7_PROWI|nr:hypothetical protein QBZ16_005320 [Prototheca wickerhamii]